MIARMSIAIVVLAALVALSPALSLAQGDEPRVRCGEKYMTLMVTGGKDHLTAGPLVVRQSDVRAIYVSRGNKLTMFIDAGRIVIRATIEPEMLKPVVECLG